eukprot:GEMP01023753.1.p1 GENE.GEMP01023753.1~~GEMP01023753.1.p1  ORF type:complete len:506 (+),score=135.01 GEMP01023753.1:168-1685(+)
MGAVGSLERRRFSKRSAEPEIEEMRRSTYSTHSGFRPSESSSGSASGVHRVCASCRTQNFFSVHTPLDRGFVCYVCSRQQQIPDQNVLSSENPPRRSFDKAHAKAVNEVAKGLVSANKEATVRWQRLREEVEVQCALSDGEIEFIAVLRECSQGDDVTQLQLVLKQMEDAGLVISQDLIEALCELSKSEDGVALWSYLKTALEDIDRMSIETFSEALPPDAVRHTEIFLKMCEAREILLLRKMAFDNKLAEAIEKQDVDALLNLAEDAHLHGLNISGAENALARILGTQDATGPSVSARAEGQKPASGSTSSDSESDGTLPPGCAQRQPHHSSQASSSDSDGFAHRPDRPRSPAPKPAPKPRPAPERKPPRPPPASSPPSSEEDWRTKPTARPSWAGRGPRVHGVGPSPAPSPPPFRSTAHGRDEAPPVRNSRQSAMSRADALAVLGFAHFGDPTVQELKVAYRKSALEWHPDRAKNHAAPDIAKERFQKAKEAFDRLKGAARET